MFANIPIHLYKNDPNKSWSGKVGSYEKQEYINIIQGETDSEILNFHLFLDDSKPLDLTDKTVTFYFTKPDGEKIFLQADIPQESAENGIALVTLTAQCTSVSGLTRDGVIRVTDTNDSVLKFPVPSMYIAASDCEHAVESTSEFHALDIALNSASQALTDAKAAAENAQNVLESDRQALANIEAAIADAYNASESANTAADNANDKAVQADNAALSANSAAADAANAATAANTAAQACNSAVSDMNAIAQAEVEKHAQLTNNPHHITAAQIGAANKTASIQNLEPMDGLKLGNNKVCKAIISDLNKVVCAELSSTEYLTAGSQLLQLPNVTFGYVPKGIFVNRAFCLAWIYSDGSLKTLQDIPANAEIIIDFSYI
ncbi:MAG: hypothetical protein ACFWUC_02415 [Oscillospiraceae bacterium]